MVSPGGKIITIDREVGGDLLADICLWDYGGSRLAFHVASKAPLS
jgi:hypothetical protein